MVIVDASIVCKAVLQEEGREKVKIIFDKHVEGTEEVTVPNLLFYEVANTLATKSGIPKAQITRSLNKLAKLNLVIYNPPFQEIIKAASFAKKNHVSVYDAIYVILAREKKCDLITADEKFVDQVKLPFVKKLSSVA